MRGDIGNVTPTSDDAPWQGRVIEGQREADSSDCAQAGAHCKRIATLTARTALLGLELRQMADGAWQVLTQFGRPATVQSLQAAEALVYGCELVRSDVAALAARLAPSREVQRA